LAVKVFIVSPLPLPLRSRQARNLARQPASGTDSLSRVRGHSERHEHGHDEDQAGGHALLR
jgi:hypothetical protein